MKTANSAAGSNSAPRCKASLLPENLTHARSLRYCGVTTSSCQGVHAERHDFSVALWCCSNGKALPDRVERRRPALHSGQPAIRGIYAAATSHLDTNAQGELETRVTADGQKDGQLMVLRWKNGSVYFGVSRGMLRLANYPWSGSESEETLIFEVERRLTHSASPSRAQHWHFARKRSQSSIDRQANAAVLLSN